MLDLNLDMVSSESSCDENMNTNDKVMVLTAMEDSGSTKSSIINDEDVPSNACRSENSSNAASPGSTALVFDILKKETNDAAIGKRAENPSPDFVTRQHFPVTGEKSGVELEFGIQPLASRPQWLNLSYAAESSTGEAKLMTTVPVKPQPKKSRRGPRSRSSQYRGVTFYRRTGRWESHIWDCGKQVYLGGFDTAHAAARAYDRAAIKFRGVEADINFTLGDYEEDMKQMRHMNKEEFVHALRRQSNGFSRGNSKYRGVTLHKCGRWEARMGQFLGKKAYDMAAIKSNGSEAVTNFEPSTYEGGGTYDAMSAGKCDHNLDLSLGISAPSVARNRSTDARDFHLRIAAAGVQPQHGLTIAPKHPPMLSSVNPAAPLPCNEEMTMPSRAEAVFSTGYSNWAWQMQGDGKIVSSTPVFPIAAASSGFSSSIAIASSTTLPFDNSGRKPAPATSTNNISHYHNYRS